MVCQSKLSRPDLPTRIGDAGGVMISGLVFCALAWTIASQMI